MLGEPLTGKQAESWGLVTAAIASGALDAAVEKVLDTLRHQSGWALSAAKGLINRGLQASFESSLEFEIGAAIEAELGADAENAADNFARS
jgi:enoyl-CoA hydratase/carnithine racemase